MNDPRLSYEHPRRVSSEDAAMREIARLKASRGRAATAQQNSVVAYLDRRIQRAYLALRGTRGGW